MRDCWQLERPIHIVVGLLMKYGMSLLIFIIFMQSLRAEPVETVANNDLKIFLSSLALEENSLSDPDETTSNLHHLAEREMLSSQLTATQLYDKVNAVLAQITPTLQKIYQAKLLLREGQFSREVRCFEVGCDAGILAVGFGFRISLGLVHTPRWSYPTFGFRIRYLLTDQDIFNRDWATFGAGMVMGIERDHRNGDDSDFTFFKVVQGNISSENIMKAGGVGLYQARADDGKKAQGLALGVGYIREKLFEQRLELPIPVPVYHFAYEAEILKALKAVVDALYFFDFETVAYRVNEFNRRSERILKKLQRRGLDLSGAPPLFPEHPLASPGMLFHPRALLRYAPKELIPQNLAPLDCEKAAQRKGPGLLGFK